MPTNRVTKGNKLSKAVLQPGWTIENDGFGLLTCSASYICSHGTDSGSEGGNGEAALKAAPTRGDTFIKDGRLSCHRVSSSLNSNGLMVVTAEFVGIESGSMTRPQVSGRGSMSTDPITTHPKFESKIGGSMGSPMNGAVFRADGSFDKFAEHIPPRDKYGVKSYLNPGFTINGFFYSNNIGTASALKSSMGKCSDTGFFNNVNLLGDLSGIGPSWNGVGMFQAENESPQLLLTGINLDFFGKLVKIGYEITFATGGWDVDIYPYVNGNYKGSGSGGSSKSGGKWPTSYHSDFNVPGGSWHNSLGYAG